MRRARFVPLLCALAGIALTPLPLRAQESRVVAFVDVNVIPMEASQLLRDRTVLVEGDRIVAIGPTGTVEIPAGATIIEGGGRYLVPGLTDAHVHLYGDGTATGTTRPDFGDAPLYLAHGITTVINLRGLPEHLDWRARIERGELAGPTIYTSGDFIDEPRVRTPDDVQREVERQAAAGFDLVKYHEIYSRNPEEATTVGLSAAAYARLNAAAREIGIPLVGHAPVHLGLDAVLQARQPLAHMGALSNLYFLPMVANRGWVVVTGAAFAIMLALTAFNGIMAIVRSRHAVPRASERMSRVRIFADFVLLTAVLAAACAILVLPGGPWYDSALLRVVFTGLCIAMAVMATFLLVITVSTWSDPSVSAAGRVQASIASAVGLVLACTALAFWVPVAWRSSDSGIDWLARRLRAAEIPVQTTLVAYEAIGGPGKAQLAADPMIQYLRPDIQARWQRFAQRRYRGFRYTEFMKKVAGALNRAGVPLMAGTDAMGFLLVTPGSSLHRELELLVEGGLTPYEAMRAATVAPARFLGRQHEFGTIAVGKRADLLLIDGNPAEDVRRLREPIGVMARGHWYPRAELQRMLDGLLNDSE